MKTNIISKFNNENKFNPLKISQKIKKQCTYYEFFNEQDKFVGKLELDDEGKYFFKKCAKHIGYITGLEIPQWLRGKKEVINIFLNIRQLVSKEAEKRNMDIVHFAAGNDNPNHVAKLYKKLFPEAIYKFNDGYTRFAVPIKETDKEHAVQLLEDFGIIYRDLNLRNEIEIPPIVCNGMDFI